VFSNKRESYPEAKRAISDYKKAVGDPAGLTELMVFYSECASSFTSEYGNDDVGYYNVLIRMFEEALQCATNLPDDQEKGFFARLEDVRDVCHQFGYGVGDQMDDLLMEYTHRDDEKP